MRRIRILLTIIVLPLLVLAGAPYISSEVSGAAPASNEPESTIDAQESVAVTVYNSNIALVKDIRKIALPRGHSEIKFTDVAAQILPQTVFIKSLSDPDSLAVLEQNYEYDLLTPRKLLEKFVGKQIAILKDGVEIPVTILSTQEGIVYQLGERIFTGHPHNMVFPSIPANLQPRPTLNWSLQSAAAKPQTVQASYLTRGMNWKADYVAVLGAADKQMDLNGWVTLNNQSGTTYRNAKLKLVAGDVNRIVEEYNVIGGSRDRAELASKVANETPFAEQSFFEYHLYSLQRPTTVKNLQTKQVSLLSAGAIPVSKSYRYYGAPHYYRSRIGVPLANQKVGVYVEIANKKENNLGMPLPKGILRVYKADNEGNLQFIGEDRIDHTAKDEKVKIKMGDAFDIIAERKQTDWRKIASDIYEAAFEVTLRNHKEEAVTVNVVEPMPRDWQLLHQSHEHEKLEAHTIQFELPVARDGETKLTYRARYKF